MTYSEAVKKLISILEDKELHEALITIQQVIKRLEKLNEEEKETPIFLLDFSTRAKNVLKRSGVNTLENLLDKSEEILMKMRCMGKKTLIEIKDKLKSMGYELKEREDE